MQFPNLVSTRFRPLRNHPKSSRSWTGHLPFASDLIDSLRPSLLVELGVQYGDSYFGFCQAIKETGTGCTCYAIDTWHGDRHAGFYDDEVFREVQSYNDQHYKSFSYLMRASFDDAISHFSSESIDLLHIDGFHTYDAAKHDFENWLSKVRPGGIVLMHDVLARRADYGVWRLWEEIVAHFHTFTFHHSHGLGVVRKPGGSIPQAGILPILFNPVAGPQPVRDYYEALADRVDAAFFRYRSFGEQSSDRLCQVFFAAESGYSEQFATNTRISAGSWERLVFDLPEGALKNPLRIDPADCSGLIQLKDIIIKHPSGRLIWRANLSTGFSVAGTSFKVPQSGLVQLFSYGNDPQILLAVPWEATADLHGPVTLEFSIRVQRELTDLAALGSQISSWLLAFEAQPLLESEQARLKEALAAMEHQTKELLQALAESETRSAALEATKTADAEELQRLKTRIEELEGELGIMRVENLLQSNELAWQRSGLSRGIESSSPGDLATTDSVGGRGH